MKIVKIDRRQKPQAGAKGRKFKPIGMHKKSYKPIIKWIEEMGFVYVSQKNHAIWKHPQRKCASISIATTPTSKNYVQELVYKIRNICIN
jgi:predicted RNA binding protein YcfA (HicA-like mRNA interferase family)